MGNHCHKPKNKKKDKNKGNEENTNLEPPLIKEGNKDPVSETNRSNLVLGTENSHELFTKLISPDVTEGMKSSNTAEKLLNKAKDADIDILVSVLKKMSDLHLEDQMKTEILSKIRSEYLNKATLFSEYQSKYLSLNPKDSKELGMNFLSAEVYTYHLLKLYGNSNEEKKYHNKWDEVKNQTDMEYLQKLYSNINDNIKKHFKISININNTHKEPEKNLDIFKNITKNFIDEVFSLALEKYNEENFVESWNMNHNEKFGKESDHKAQKCFDYQFKIHMLSH